MCKFVENERDIVYLLKSTDRWHSQFTWQWPAAGQHLYQSPTQHTDSSHDSVSPAGTSKFITTTQQTQIQLKILFKHSVKAVEDMDTVIRQPTYLLSLRNLLVESIKIRPVGGFPRLGSAGSVPVSITTLFTGWNDGHLAPEKNPHHLSWKILSKQPEEENHEGKLSTQVHLKNDQ